MAIASNVSVIANGGTRPSENGGAWGLPPDNFIAGGAWNFDAGDTDSQNKGGFAITSDKNEDVIPANAKASGVVITNGLRSTYFENNDNQAGKDITFDLAPSGSLGYQRVFYKWRFLQPINFTHNVIINITAPEAFDLSAWVAGDTISIDSGAKTAKLLKKSGSVITVINPTDTISSVWGNVIVTNDTQSQSFTSESSQGFVNNDKFIYSDPSFSGTQGNFRVEARAYGRAFGVGDEIIGNSYIKVNAGGGAGTYERVNEVPGADNVLIDINDNGTIVEFWIEFYRAASSEVRVWKRASSTSNQIVKIYEATGFEGLEVDGAGTTRDRFKYGYFMGNKNSAVAQDDTVTGDPHLDYYTTYFELRTQKFDELGGL